MKRRSHKIPDVPRDWLLTPYRAAVHLPTQTAVVADVHLGYDRARRRSGEAVPDFTFQNTIAALQSLFHNVAVRRLVIAGDLIEARLPDRFVQKLVGWLANGSVELAAVVPGNHDRSLAGRWLPLYPNGFVVGEWRVVHGDGSLPRGRVVLGHYHPCLRLAGAKVPCYLVGANRLFLPAFSQDAAGVNALRNRSWSRYRCLAVAAERVLDFGELRNLRGKQVSARPAYMKKS